jgi:hypothetical protein
LVTCIETGKCFFLVIRVMVSILFIWTSMFTRSYVH